MKFDALRLFAATLPLSACAIVVGSPNSCGEHPADGGPAVITTRDQELCDVVRIRVAKELDDDAALNYEKIDALIEKCGSWQGKDTLDDLVKAIRRDAGDATADAVRRAVDAVLAQSKKPMRADCADVQKCLVKGAVKGVRIALAGARPYSSMQTPEAPTEK